MRIDKILVAIAVCTIVTGSLYGGGIVLVENGRPKAKLVLSANPTEAERTAAEDLQGYLQKMSGAELPITETDAPPEGPIVLIGHSEAAKKLVGFLLSEETLGHDGFIVKTFANRLVVVGRDTTSTDSEYSSYGTRFATFALLEELGCRFFTPHPDGEHIPQAKTIKVGDLNIVSKPDFAARRFRANSRTRNTFTEQTHQRWQGWSVKSRLGGIHLPTGHNYDAMVPPRLFAEHPEYFAYDRQTKQRSKKREQPCLSNPDVLRLTVDYARSFLDKRPSAAGASLSPADEPGWCECDQCLSMDNPDPTVGWATRVLEFNNRVAEQVSKTHPGKYFPYYAEYMNMPGPPVYADGSIALQAHPAVVPVIVNRFCYLHDINEATCSLNAEYRRRLDGWRQVSQFQDMYEYFNHNFHAPRMPTPQNWLVGPRIRYYRDMGMIGYRGSILVYGPDTDLNMYVSGKMLWDSDQDPDALIDEYFRLHFQEAAGQMRAFYEAYNRVGRGPEIHRMYVLNDQWTPQVFAQLKPLMAAARAAARQPVIKRRVEREWNWFKVWEGVGQAHWTYYQWFYDANEARREQAKLATARVIGLLEEIADQDIVADSWLIKRIKDTYLDPLERGRSFRGGKASSRPGYGDEETFGDLWDKHELIADLPEQWKFHEDNQGIGIRSQWYSPEIDDSKWGAIRIGEFWNNQGYPTTDVGWYRLSIPIGRELENRKLLLFFGGVDLWAHVWINGHDVADRFCYKLESDKRFSVDISPYVKPGQDNLIVVRVQDYERLGGIWKPIKLVSPKQ